MNTAYQTVQSSSVFRKGQSIEVHPATHIGCVTTWEPVDNFARVNVNFYTYDPESKEAPQLFYSYKAYTSRSYHGKDLSLEDPESNITALVFALIERENNNVYITDWINVNKDFSGNVKRFYSQLELSIPQAYLSVCLSDSDGIYAV